eukprot:Nitzschia sp. Nitz4//scaffold334_size18717//13005//14970//NITZ4_008764-RA/size18717-augustus-gene-0.4-mRNA-1//-1//CDS//3329548257//3149//frame0
MSNSDDKTPQLVSIAKKWVDMDPNPTTAAYVRNLMDQATKESSHEEAANQLAKLFPLDDTRISFGTAGLRAAMRPGPLAMNDLTVLQTAQGIAKYCLANFPSATEKLSVVIGYDHRANAEMQISSLSFAVLSALVFQQAGIDCILLDGLVHTPMVPFTVRQLGAVAGIMVTASHNPKQDDGYKVYASDACQIRAPIDQEIAAEILQNLAPWTDYGKLLQERKAKFPDDPTLGLGRPEITKTMKDAYIEKLVASGLKTGQASIPSDPSLSLPPPVFAYTAMHGVGRPFAERIFQAFDLPTLHLVPSQQDPNPDFPTVSFPNPEESGALDLAKEFAETNQCDIVLANDPDADRLAVAERSRSTGEWTIFSGDQIGVLFGHWLWTQIGRSSKETVSMCASIVSSQMLAEIARVEGFHFESTLTGFKWIGSRSAALSKEGNRHLFAYEEAIGFACGDVIFDKDGVSAMAVMSELALFAYRNGYTLQEQMQKLYDTYGEFVTYNGYYVLEDPKVGETLLERIRGGGTYDTVDVSPYTIASIRDLGVGYDSSQPDNKASLPAATMMTLCFTNGCTVQFRPSGTEPKFKFYIEMKGNPGVSREQVSKELAEMAPYVLDKLLEPTKNGLKRN